MKYYSARRFLRTSLAALLLSGAALWGPSYTPWAQDTAWAASQQALHIGDIQGAAHTSSYDGKKVRDIQGVVTFRASASTFYIQDDGDGRNDTSDAIMVYAPDTSVSIGDLVSIDGTVTEFYGPGYRGKEETDLTTTEIKADKVRILGQKALPAPVVLDKDRMIPRKVIDSDGLTKFNPDTDAIDFWESLEGMRVTVQNPHVLGPQRYGEIYVVPGTNQGPFNNSGGLSITSDDYHPEHVCLQLIGDGAKNFVAKASDHFDGDVTGVVTYGFGTYKVSTRMNQLPKLIDGGLQHEKSTIVPDENKLLVASYNIENFSANPATTPDSKVTRLAQSIAHDLNLPDIITVLELQDNDGKEDSGDADASKSAGRLISAIKAESGTSYECVNINPVYNADGGQPGANIRVAMFYNPARVQLKPGKMGGSTDANSWKDGHLALNPGRVDPNNELFSHTRKSLAAEFTFRGKDVVIIANHLNSKLGDDSLYGKNQPLRLRSAEKRLKLANDIAGFVKEGVQQNPDLPILLTGDFNDFEFSPTIKALEGAGLTNLVGRHDLADRYSFYYQGNNQILDNILVSQNLLNRYTFDIVHVNSPFMEQQGRVSDHDPLLIQLDLR